MVASGTQAPDTELYDKGGDPVRIRDLTAGEPALLEFFKITCPVCQFTFPFLERLSSAVKVYGISQDDAEGTAEFSRAFGITFPMLFDSADGYAASNAWGISHVPTLFLVEPDGRISLAGSGFSKQDLEAVAARFGATVFEGERVPEFRPG